MFLLILCCGTRKCVKHTLWVVFSQLMITSCFTIIMYLLFFYVSYAKGYRTISSSRAIMITIVFISLAIILAIILMMRRCPPKCQTITILHLPGCTPSCGRRDVRIRDKAVVSTTNDIIGTCSRIKTQENENLKDDASTYPQVFDPESAYSLVIDDNNLVRQNSDDDIYCPVENPLHAKVNI
ncbi:hypothetical protein HOLleu_23419 [Holothuria leucospilota]|uniref:Uncharacterized protein n=1 Tax=Holothuria leucospilota TaxID=206669 RepID=A0A9Q1BVB3_HOLLE|nr:hypothetical protein HOLleu_23419 [Holothuria leucospilota]